MYNPGSLCLVTNWTELGRYMVLETLKYMQNPVAVLNLMNPSGLLTYKHLYENGLMSEKEYLEKRRELLR